MRPDFRELEMRNQQSADDRKRNIEGAKERIRALEGSESTEQKKETNDILPSAVGENNEEKDINIELGGNPEALDVSLPKAIRKKQKWLDAKLLALILAFPFLKGVKFYRDNSRIAVGGAKFIDSPGLVKRSVEGDELLTDVISKENLEAYQDMSEDIAEIYDGYLLKNHGLEKKLLTAEELIDDNGSVVSEDLAREIKGDLARYRGVAGEVKVRAFEDIMKKYIKLYKETPSADLEKRAEIAASYAATLNTLNSSRANVDTSDRRSANMLGYAGVIPDEREYITETQQAFEVFPDIQEIAGKNPELTVIKSNGDMETVHFDAKDVFAQVIGRELRAGYMGEASGVKVSGLTELSKISREKSEQIKLAFLNAKARAIEKELQDKGRNVESDRIVKALSESQIFTSDKEIVLYLDAHSSGDLTETPLVRGRLFGAQIELGINRTVIYEKANGEKIVLPMLTLAGASEGEELLLKYDNSIFIARVNGNLCEVNGVLLSKGGDSAELVDKRWRGQLPLILALLPLLLFSLHRRREDDSYGAPGKAFVPGKIADPELISRPKPMSRLGITHDEILNSTSEHFSPSSEEDLPSNIPLKGPFSRGANKNQGRILPTHKGAHGRAERKQAKQVISQTSAVDRTRIEKNVPRDTSNGLRGPGKSSKGVTSRVVPNSSKGGKGVRKGDFNKL